MVTKEWVAVHRKHHAHCETTEDPHSPRTYGIKTVLWEGADLYRHAIQTQPEMMEKFGHATPNDTLERHLYSRFRYLGIIIMLILDIVLLGVPGIAVWAIQMMWIPFLQLVLLMASVIMLVIVILKRLMPQQMFLLGEF